MNVVFTDAAAKDLDEIIEYLKTHYPAVVPAVQRRMAAVLAHLSQSPNAGRTIRQRPGVRVASLVRYPYKIFYHVTDDAIEIVHIRHAARRPWDAER